MTRGGRVAVQVEPSAQKLLGGGFRGSICPMSGPAGFSGAGQSDQASHGTGKYGGMKPKNPLLNRNHDASYFDSADYQLRTMSGARTGGTPSQLRPAYPTAKQGGSPRKMAGRVPSNLGRAEEPKAVAVAPGAGQKHTGGGKPRYSQHGDAPQGRDKTNDTHVCM
ncbi:MAG: hypothetical protein ABGY24_17070 [bacterium]